MSQSTTQTSHAQDSREKLPGRVLPREQGAVSLDLVIAVMAFLAALALGGVLIAQRTAESWQAGLAGRLTVQIMPERDGAPPTETNAAVRVLRTTPGILSASALSDADNLALVEPWLGRDAVIGALPFPRLIDVQLAPGATPDLATLQKRLKAAAPHAVLDDHGRWIGRLKATANSVVLAALAILALIAIGTAATVAFATRAGLAAHHEIVQLLHLMGAQDRFIARAFEWHYFVAAGVAGACGAAFATVIFVGAGSLDELGLSSVPFLPPLGLPMLELAWLAAIPAGAAAIAWATARISVIAALRELY
jgi:cell division transport system permease protein